MVHKFENIKEMLDFMKKYDIDSLKFRIPFGIDYIEFELCYFRDYPEESLGLFEGEKRLVHAYDRKYFEELIEKFEYIF